MGLDLRSERGKLIVSRAVKVNGVRTRKEYFAGDTLEQIETFRVVLGDRLTAQVLARIRSGLPIPPDTKPEKAATKIVKKKPAKRKAAK